MASELDFIESIDCCFPYTESARAASLIDAACSLSPNAVLTVVHELARPPAGVQVSAGTRHRLLDLIEQKFSHPSLSIILPIARTMIDGGDISVDSAVVAMNQLGKEAPLYQALNIAYFSCEDDDGHAEAAYERITASWKRLASTPTKTDRTTPDR